MNDVSKLRATVIEEMVGIEWVIGSLISHHYLGRPIKAFMLDVVHDPSVPTAAKINMLQKCSQLSPQAVQQLREMANIRNIFAHVAVTLVEMVDGEELAWTPDPRSGDPLSFQAKFDRFRELGGAVLSALVSEAERVGMAMYTADASQGMK